MAIFASLRPVVVVLPAEVYPVPRVVAVRVGEREDMNMELSGKCSSDSSGSWVEG